jgi:hypothetical protein
MLRVQWKSIERRLIQQHVQQHGRRFLDAQSSRYIIYRYQYTLLELRTHPRCHGCTEIQRWRNLAAVHDTGFFRVQSVREPVSFTVSFNFFWAAPCLFESGVRTNCTARRWTICSLPPNPIYGVCTGPGVT